MTSCADHARGGWGSRLLPAITLALACALATLAPGCGKPEYVVESAYGVEDPQFARTMGNLLGPPLLQGNEVRTLLNGDEIFPAMLEAIRSARKTITMETYVYWNGTVGEEFTQALVDRAKAGVEVRLIIDAFGSATIDLKHIDEVHDAGGKVAMYHPIAWYDAVGSIQKINNRTHRKLLVVDGEIGYIGGAGIADEWTGHAQDKDHWRDNHYEVRGPIVAQLQATFMDNWMDCTGEVLHDERYFPALQPAGNLTAQVFKSSFRGGNDSMHLMYLLSLAAARKSVLLGTPYFIPDDVLEQQIIKARQRGVEVTVLLPGEVMDEPMVRRISRANWGELLRAGVRIFEFQPTMYHTKVLIVDGLWTSIGSANLDPRSLKLNCEANLNVLDAGFAAEQTRFFEEDLKRCKETTYEEWQHRPLIDRILEPLEGLFGPQL